MEGQRLQVGFQGDVRLHLVICYHQFRLPMCPQREPEEVSRNKESLGTGVWIFSLWRARLQYRFLELFYYEQQSLCLF